MRLHLAVSHCPDGGVWLEGLFSIEDGLVANTCSYQAGHAVVMCDKSFSFLTANNSPLPGHFAYKTYVVQRELAMGLEVMRKYPCVAVYDCLEGAIHGALLDRVDVLWVIGGSDICRSALHHDLAEVWLTETKRQCACQGEFPIAHFGGLVAEFVAEYESCKVKRFCL